MAFPGEVGRSAATGTLGWGFWLALGVLAVAQVAEASVQSLGGSMVAVCSGGPATPPESE